MQIQESLRKKGTFSLYNVERKEIIEIPEYTYAVNVYGDYIGILAYHKGRTHKSIYNYSTDRGKTWIKETPPDSWLQGAPGMYGNGHVWVMAIGNKELKYPLMVRIEK